MKKRLTLGLATLATLVGLGGAAQAQPYQINIPGTGFTVQTSPYVYPNSSYYYNYDSSPNYNYYPSSSQYSSDRYYNYNRPGTREGYYRHSRGFPAAHETRNYYYDNSGRYYYRWR